MFRIKICGITTPEDGQLAAEAGADAIGLNFYAGSPRCVTEAMAKAIIDSLPAGVAKVGVFVNMPPTNVADIADRLQLDWIQLHGDEPPEAIAELAPRRVIRALPCGPGGLKTVVAFFQHCKALGSMPAALLADAAAGNSYGGTGRTAAWSELVLPREWLHGIPLVLAGGLTPENVAKAVDTVQPQSVDTASGVESAPGRKYAPLLKSFVSAAKASLRVDAGIA
ncbi:MAG: phosphoribosylanthranilate isomerase [Planctomycetes bacterium]|nr:phosphoribosylanthranilate isomerase [Planctomycetota bacterium]